MTKPVPLYDLDIYVKGRWVRHSTVKVHEPIGLAKKDDSIPAVLTPISRRGRPSTST